MLATVQLSFHAINRANSQVPQDADPNDPSVRNVTVTGASEQDCQAAQDEIYLLIQDEMARRDGGGSGGGSGGAPGGSSGGRGVSLAPATFAWYSFAYRPTRLDLAPCTNALVDLCCFNCWRLFVSGATAQQSSLVSPTTVLAWSSDAVVPLSTAFRTNLV